MDPKKSGGKASYAATSSSSPKNSVGHFSEGSGFRNIPKVDHLIRGVAALKPPQDIDWSVFSKKNKNQGETSSPKLWGTRINEELCEMVCDREIVWPPMVMVRYHEKDDNEKVYKDDNEKRIHGGNLKLPDYDDATLARHSVGPHGLLHHFSVYNAVEARHSFGHTGISLLIFENSVMGYLEAEQLHQDFADRGTGKGTGKDAWDQCKLLDGTHLRGTGKDAWDQCKLLDGTHHHQFYGYMANKEDVDIFNQHCRGEMKVKFEMRSHYEMVVVPMDGVDQHLFLLYNEAVKAEKDAKTRQDFYCKAAEKLCETMEENRIVRKRTKLQHEQNKAEFFKDQINHIHQASEEERAFEELLPEERKKMKQSIVDTSANENKNQGETSSPKQWETRINEELCETVCDREIVWPPMVMVRYHEKVDKDDNKKWIRRGNWPFCDLDAILARHGVGPGGLLHYFSGYNAVEARHSFGHIGTSLLIFENSAIGYVEAERLHKHFADQGTGKDAWDHCRRLDGTRHQFYGYMANKEDVDIFNQHSGGKWKVKFEMRSHHEMVVIPMDGVNQRLFWLYSRSVKGEKDAKARQDYNGKLAEKLRKTMEENRIVGKRTKLQHEQNKAEFFKDQINHIHQASEEERAFEELLPEERKKTQQSIVDTIANEDLRQEGMSKVIQTQAKNIKELFEAERENIIQILEEKPNLKLLILHCIDRTDEILSPSTEQDTPISNCFVGSSP